MVMFILKSPNLKNMVAFSGRKLDDMQAGASERVDVEVEKKHPFDFVLWKHAKENEPSCISLG